MQMNRLSSRWMEMNHHSLRYFVSFTLLVEIWVRTSRIENVANKANAFILWPIQIPIFTKMLQVAMELIVQGTFSKMALVFFGFCWYYYFTWINNPFENRRRCFSQRRIKIVADVRFGTHHHFYVSVWSRLTNIIHLCEKLLDGFLKRKFIWELTNILSSCLYLNMILVFFRI